MEPVLLANIVGVVMWLAVGAGCISITGIKLRRSNAFKTLVCILAWPVWIFYFVNKED